MNYTTIEVKKDWGAAFTKAASESVGIEVKKEKETYLNIIYSVSYYTTGNLIWLGMKFQKNLSIKEL